MFPQNLPPNLRTGDRPVAPILSLDATQCLLMAKVAARLDNDARCVFWETLPDSILDLNVHLPALTAAVAKGTDLAVLEKLSVHPLPPILSPEMAGWRLELMTAWENRLKTAREGVNRSGGSFVWSDINEYIWSVRGVTQVNAWAAPSATTCPSALPILLKEARDIRASFMYPGTPSWKVYEQLKCLAALSDWRPAQNVRTEAAVLNEWADFWLALYQKPAMNVGQGGPEAPIIMEGLAAKALLNLLEAGSEEETGVPTGMETFLLESLTKAVNAAGKKKYYPLGWLKWQPRDVTRFPIDKLVKLPETLLRKFRISCQNPDTWQDERQQNVRHDSLTELVRWDRAGLLAVCGIDLLPRVVTRLIEALDSCFVNHFRSEYLLNHEVCRWLVRDEVANIEGGKELLQRLEGYWRYECRRKNYWWYNSEKKCLQESPPCIAWNGRIQLQRTGLATESPADFHENLLEAIKNEQSGSVRVVLSIWKPRTDTPAKVRRTWDRLCHEGLKSNHETMFLTAALAFLRPDPTDAPAVRQQKVRDVLWRLPEPHRPKLSVAELMHLMEIPSWANPNASPGADANREWQLMSGEMRFRVPTEVSTEPAAPASTTANAQTADINRTGQRPASS